VPQRSPRCCRTMTKGARLAELAHARVREHFLWRGVTDSRGLYFLGMHNQHSRGSSLIHWVTEDAAYIVEQIKPFPHQHPRDEKKPVLIGGVSRDPPPSIAASSTRHPPAGRERSRLEGVFPSVSSGLSSDSHSAS
jgi:hypothetical protein